MAYYLRLDSSGDEYVQLDSNIPLVGYFRINLSVQMISRASTDDHKILDSIAGSNRLDINLEDGGELNSRNYCHFEVDGVAATSIDFDTDVVFSIIRDSTDADQSDKSFGVIGCRYNLNTFANMRIYDIEVLDSSGARTDFLNSSSSSGTGLVLPNDEDSSNEGNLNNFSGTTDSWWVFYSTGISVTATLGTISYSSNDTSVSVTGSVDVVATLGTISYASNNAVITTTGTVDVTATLGTISYTSNNPSVSVTGIIPIAATLGTISYTSNNVTVFVQDGQDIGVVTASFKPNPITVNFRG